MIIGPLDIAVRLPLRVQRAHPWHCRRCNRHYPLTARGTCPRCHGPLRHQVRRSWATSAARDALRALRAVRALATVPIIQSREDELDRGEM